MLEQRDCSWRVIHVQRHTPSARAFTLVLDASTTGVAVASARLRGAFATLVLDDDGPRRMLGGQVTRIEQLGDDSLGLEWVLVEEPASVLPEQALERTHRISSHDLQAARAHVQALRASRGGLPAAAAQRTERLAMDLDARHHGEASDQGTTPMSWEEIDALHREPPRSTVERMARARPDERATEPMGAHELAALARRLNGQRTRR